MAGRKKRGLLSPRATGVRLDEPIDRIVDDICAEHHTERGTVIRTIVTAWMMGQLRPVEEWIDIFRKVESHREAYLSGVDTGRRSGGRAKGPAGTRRRDAAG